jgi:hypothetical protein
MRAEISSVVHKHKVAPEGKGPGRDLGSLWVRMWSIAWPLLFAFSLCAGGNGVRRVAVQTGHSGWRDRVVS